PELRPARLGNSLAPVSLSSTNSSVQREIPSGSAGGISAHEAGRGCNSCNVGHNIGSVADVGRRSSTGQERKGCPPNPREYRRSRNGLGKCCAACLQPTIQTPSGFRWFAGCAASAVEWSFGTTASHEI